MDKQYYEEARFIKRSLPGGKGQKVAQLPHSGIDAGVDQKSQPQRENGIFWYQ